MKPRHIMTLVFAATMVLGNLIAADFTPLGLLRGFGLGLVAAMTFHGLIALANRMTGGGVDQGFEQMGRRG